MTKNTNVETLAMLIRQSEKVRTDFCKDVGITLDDFYVKQNGDFEIEDMVRAFQKGFGMALIPLQEQLTKKDTEIAKLKEQLSIRFEFEDSWKKEKEEKDKQIEELKEKSSCSIARALRKENKKLEAQIEKMKCCSNCKNIYDTEKKKCINCTAKNNFCNWELTEIGICMGVSD